MKAVVLLLVLGAVFADKDDSYYMANNGNPNVQRKMYWKDSHNVLQDLGNFSSLYVEFHYCVWSWMSYAETSDEVDENDYWYLGSVPSMGANVAFSLYGSLEGEKFAGCTQNSFINSFYTDNGFQDFATAMNLAGLSGFYDDGDLNAQCQGGYGVGCDYSNGFAVHKYSGDDCNPQNVTAVSDKLSNLNQAMSSAECVKIYDYSVTAKRQRSASNKYYSSNYGSNYSVYGTPLELLLNSSACNYMNSWSPDGDCPDPYGVISSYIESYNQGMEKKLREDPFIAYEQDKAQAIKQIFFGGIFGVMAVIAVFLEFCCTLRDICVARMRRMKKEKMVSDDENTVPGSACEDRYVLHDDTAAQENPEGGSHQSDENDDNIDHTDEGNESGSKSLDEDENIADDENDKPSSLRSPPISPPASPLPSPSVPAATNLPMVATVPASEPINGPTLVETVQSTPTEDRSEGSKSSPPAENAVGDAGPLTSHEEQPRPPSPSQPLSTNISSQPMDNESEDSAQSSTHASSEVKKSMIEDVVSSFAMMPPMLPALNWSAFMPTGKEESEDAATPEPGEKVSDGEDDTKEKLAAAEKAVDEPLPPAAAANDDSALSSENVMEHADVVDADKATETSTHASKESGSVESGGLNDAAIADVSCTDNDGPIDPVEASRPLTPLDILERGVVVEDPAVLLQRIRCNDKEMCFVDLDKSHVSINIPSLLVALGKNKTIRRVIIHEDFLVELNDVTSRILVEAISDLPNLQCLLILFPKDFHFSHSLGRILVLKQYKTAPAEATTLATKDVAMLANGDDKAVLAGIIQRFPSLRHADLFRLDATDGVDVDLEPIPIEEIDAASEGAVSCEEETKEVGQAILAVRNRKPDIERTEETAVQPHAARPIHVFSLLAKTDEEK